MDRVSIERTCAGEFQVEGADTEKARDEKLLVIPGGLVGKEICIGRTLRSGSKTVRNEFSGASEVQFSEIGPT